MPKSKGKQCCVYGCDNFAFKKDGTSTEIHFFQVPKKVLEDRKLKLRWCSLIKRQDGKDGFYMNLNTVICSDHFKKEQISIALVSKKWTLKPDQEPKVFPWITIDTPRKCPLKRSTTMRLPLESVVDDSENFDVSEPHVFGVEIGIQAGPGTCDVGCQTDDGDVMNVFDHYNQSTYNDHIYSFHADSDGENDIEILQKEIEKLSTQINDMEDQLNEYKGNRFSIEKIKDDPKAMLFYTGFINYSVFESILKYLSPKAEKLRYWRGKGEDIGLNNDARQNEKQRPARKLSIEEEFFMILVRLKVGLFVRDIADRFGIWYL
ncbi:uncharacterized protein LOC117320435 [Pecten maximus]|uniref:uncharacterized protein LOC117320435 n=1 Tax=Pecten maximus TaxID=6579 RepID=UPI001458FA7A|nr:uncharacterized protein LOC117320435 [Pecten maximus]